MTKRMVSQSSEFSDVLISWLSELTLQSADRLADLEDTLLIVINYCLLGGATKELDLPLVQEGGAVSSRRKGGGEREPGGPASYRTVFNIREIGTRL